MSTGIFRLSGLDRLKKMLFCRDLALTESGGARRDVATNSTKIHQELPGAVAKQKRKKICLARRQIS
jgi:hypothetical protein